MPKNNISGYTVKWKDKYTSKKNPFKPAKKSPITMKPMKKVKKKITDIGTSY